MPNCSKCGRPRDCEPARYCKKCHAASMKARRMAGISPKPNPARHRLNTRTNTYARRHGIKFSICSDCLQTQRLELYHPNPKKAHLVVPLCRPCKNRRQRTGKGNILKGAVDLRELAQKEKKEPLMRKFKGPFGGGFIQVPPLLEEDRQRLFSTPHHLALLDELSKEISQKRKAP